MFSYSLVSIQTGILVFAAAVTGLLVILLIVLVLTNLHSKRRSIQELHRLEEALNSLPEAVLVTDEKGKLVAANSAGLHAIGENNFPTTRRSGSMTEFIQERAPQLAALTPEGQPVELLLPDGKPYRVLARAMIQDGKPQGVVYILQDLEHTNELEALKSDFVSAVSHDLRSPLTLMRGYATMLETSENLDEQQKGYVSKIVKSVESMTRMVNDLLDLGRIEAGVGLQIEKFDPAGVAEEMISRLQLQADQKQIHLALLVEEDVPHWIKADRVLIQQAIYNLMENAIKYSPENETVGLRVKGWKDGIQVEIQDHGIGVALADQPHLFEKFYRGSQREVRSRSGSGLGLAIVNSIAQRHGGKVWVESIQGQGSTFFLQIPCIQRTET